MPVVPRQTKPGKTKGPVDIPNELRAALSRYAKAWSAFDKLPPSHQREVVGYVSEAKQPETRARRAGRTVASLKNGEIGG